MPQHSERWEGGGYLRDMPERMVTIPASALSLLKGAMCCLEDRVPMGINSDQTVVSSLLAYTADWSAWKFCAACSRSHERPTSNPPPYLLRPTSGVHPLGNLGNEA